METVTEVVKNMAGGDGEVTIKRILGEKELNGKCGLYAQVTIQPGSSLGFHEHKNESETDYILSGTAEYNDNGTTRPVKAGDVTYTPDGYGHALKPIGNEPANGGSSDYGNGTWGRVDPMYRTVSFGLQVTF